ncbi:unnamed protein product [Clonostachys solani]|uniref:Signal peptidase subunit 3 n=1 Tax=Clonostachys solani TaxID=160281 RepID=A0A9P0ELR0_9HYPO|nr:unnamed protein product [Clonostachys solani]
MHNTLNRFQSVFGFFTTVAFVLGCFIAATDFYAERAPTGTLKVQNLQVVKGRPHYYSSVQEEYAIIKFSLDADLSHLFTWNTKQVFVYVTAEWPAVKGGVNATNEAVIWDSIITNPSADHLKNIGPATMKKLKKSAQGKTVAPDRGILSLRNQRPKYQITHPSRKIADTENVKLKLHYNVQPWFGLLTWNQNQDIGFWKAIKGGVSTPFSLPSIKKKN